MVVRTLSSPDSYCFAKLKTLGVNDGKDTEVRRLLERASRAVSRIMAAHKWRVGVLEEFYPANTPNLLGLNYNRGQRIQVRVRHPHDKTVVMPYEDVLGTVLHELVHCEFGPHDKKFYDRLTEISKELEGGAVGSSGPGERLGGRPKSEDKRKAAQRAAEARNGRRLGGGEDGLHRLCPPTELAAGAALRRRAAEDDKWCNGVAKKVVAVEVIDLTDDPQDTVAGRETRKRKANSSVVIID